MFKFRLVYILMLSGDYEYPPGLPDNEIDD